jgi:hypothetical protein
MSYIAVAGVVFVANVKGKGLYLEAKKSDKGWGKRGYR